MRRSDGDLLRVPDGELTRLDGDELLRVVVITRDGDRISAAKAKTAWVELVARDIERIRGIVAAFRHPAHPQVRVARDDIDQVAQDAFLRALGMVFRGTSDPEYRKAMFTCVRFECLDHCRRQMVEDKRRAGSLDDEVTTDEGDTRPRYDKDVAKLEQERIDDEEALARFEELRDRVDEAIQNVEDERKRKVLEMTRERRPTEEIMEALDTSEANVYQLRRRALELVRDILDGSDGDGQD
jgi:RNA polymerase sigma factor (sigma-70 family)